MQHILVTNDDGFEAPGLLALRSSVQAKFPNARVVLVGPDRGRSECSHGVSAAGFEIQTHGEDVFSTSGTPADCVRAGLYYLCPDASLVISGINEGANLGVEVWVSGTVAAAREAALAGIPAVAISHYRHPTIPRTYDHVGEWLEIVWDRPELKAMFDAKKLELGNPASLWNINLPAIDPQGPPPSIELCPIDSNPIDRTAAVKGDGTLRWELDFQARPRDAGTDIDLCFGGAITMSSLNWQLATKPPRSTD
ncbi:MAG: 5'/3'-nucleotidase SurE [Planctomycetota bacterium]